jgi:hypothetical protein
MPAKNTSTQLMAAMRSEFHRGYQSIRLSSCFKYNFENAFEKKSRATADFTPVCSA